MRLFMGNFVLAFILSWSSRCRYFPSIEGAWAFSSMVSTTAFRPQSRTNPTSNRCRPCFSQPSDTTMDDDDSDEYLIVESGDYSPTPEESGVNAILDLLPNTLGSVIDTEKRSKINEALLQLEVLNPTPNPTMSPLLNGVWELKYVGGYVTEWSLPSPTRELALFLYSGGYSPGVFALNLAQQIPFVETGTLEIAISRDQPRVEASIDVKVFGVSMPPVQVRTRLEPQTGTRLKETYESATVMDRMVEIPTQLQYSRELYVTFVDEELLVVRDGSGIPEVLVRKPKTFQQNWGTEPSALEDMNPP